MDTNNAENEVDQWLDVALNLYGKAEPRAGLETRVLATIRTEGDRVDSRRRWWWAVGMAAVTATIVLAVWLGLGNRLGTPAEQRASSAQRDTGVGSHVSIDPAIQPAAHPRVRSATPSARTRPHFPEVFQMARAEQFPTPMPLTDQEKLLARYVQEFPQQAALIATAQAELRRRTELEMAAPWPDTANTFQQQER